MSDLMKGKRGLIMGVAKERSIAWGIAREMAAQGAELAFTYQGEAFGSRLAPLASTVGSDIMVFFYVTYVAFFALAFPVFNETCGKFVFIVHAVSYSDKNAFSGRFLYPSPDYF